MASDDEADTQASDSGRPRFSGSDASLLAVLKEHASGPSFCRYDERTQVRGGSVNGESIKKHGPLLKSLLGLQDSLCFNRSQLQRVLLQIGEEKLSSGKWEMMENELADWAETLTKRIRNMCRDLREAHRRHPTTSWLSELPFSFGSSCSTPAAAQAPKEPKEKNTHPQYYYGFDTEHRLAFRHNRVK